MTYEELTKKIQEIEEAIAAKDYTIDYYPPNFFQELTAPDGSSFILHVDMDGIRSSNDFGSNTIHIAGVSLECELEYGEWKSKLFDEIEEKYELPNGDFVDKDELVERIKDIVSKAKGFLSGTITESADQQVKAYEVMNNCKIEEYFWYENDDHPMDIDEFIPIEDVCDDILHIDNKKYYVVPESFEGNTLIAVSEDAKPDRYGLYETVKVVSNEPIDSEKLDKLTSLNVIPYDKMFNSTECELTDKKKEFIF